MCGLIFHYILQMSNLLSENYVLMKLKMIITNNFEHFQCQLYTLVLNICDII